MEMLLQTEAPAMLQHPRTPEGQKAYEDMLRQRHQIYEQTGILINDEGRAIATDRIRTDAERDEDERAADMELLASLVRRWGRERVTTWARNISSIEGIGK